MAVDIEAMQKALSHVEMREKIYMIESPSAEDLYCARNEGDALARTLALAEIDVIYYLATSDETFNQALTDIAIKINALDPNEVQDAMPYVHISAHGDEDGILLTDGDIIFWESLTRKLSELHELVGPIKLNPPLPAEVPRTNLSLSSCAAFTNYKKYLSKDSPFLIMMGPTRDIGWCQALIGFTTFYYQHFILRQPFLRAFRAMNAAATSNNETLFGYHEERDIMRIVTKHAENLFPLKD
ncbi:hypothetical protein [Sphingomonas sanguinis]|uniref:hypothetical protein n=1 Tax=Sphingomonas sanguinis TaxID=33051 RepID=UPI000AF53CF3|nr:hypothetical protein [Sphingomonas sanguinis]